MSGFDLYLRGCVVCDVAIGVLEADADVDFYCGEHSGTGRPERVRDVATMARPEGEVQP